MIKIIEGAGVQIGRPIKAIRDKQRESANKAKKAPKQEKKKQNVEELNRKARVRREERARIEAEDRRHEVIQLDDLEKTISSAANDVSTNKEINAGKPQSETESVVQQERLRVDGELRDAYDRFVLEYERTPDRMLLHTIGVLSRGLSLAREQLGNMKSTSSDIVFQDVALAAAKAVWRERRYSVVLNNVNWTRNLRDLQTQLIVARERLDRMPNDGSPRCDINRQAQMERIASLEEQVSMAESAPRTIQ